MKKFNDPIQPCNVWLPLPLVERIKRSARLRSLHEARQVPYVEEIRRALSQAFPEDESVRAGESTQN